MMTRHSMQRRSFSHNYTARGFYHITMSVDKEHGLAAEPTSKESLLVRMGGQQLVKR